MSVQIDTLSITVPGHVVRKNSEGSDSVLIFTGEQARYVYESLGKFTDLFMPPSAAVDLTLVGSGVIQDGVVSGKLASVGKAPE